MNKEQQRIAIAELCGWTRIWNKSIGWIIYEPDGRHNYCDPDPKACWEAHRLPDYLNDLNAMHEAEKILTYEQFDEYYVQLAMKMVRPFHASASQRAEAFLRTMGKWVE